MDVAVVASLVKMVENAYLAIPVAGIMDKGSKHIGLFPVV